MNRKKDLNSKSVGEKPKSVKGVEVDYTKPIPSVYSNYAGISHSVNEYFIDFCLIAPPYTLKAQEPVVLAQPITRIIIPAELGPLLMEALKTQINRHEETAGEYKKEISQVKNQDSSNV